jgi:uncharacterized membrane protein
VRLLALWLHLIGVIAWVGQLLYQTHAHLPAARRGDVAAFATAAQRARRVTWAAVAVVVLTGFYNVTQLGPLATIMDSGTGLVLAGKFFLVLVAVALAGHRDFAQLPALRRELARAGDPGPLLRWIAWLDRAVLVLALAIVYLGLRVSRGG